MRHFFIFLILLVPALAFADVHPAVAFMFTDIELDFHEIEGLAWPVLLLILLSFAVLKLVLRAYHKSSRF